MGVLRIASRLTQSAKRSAQVGYPLIESGMLTGADFKPQKTNARSGWF